jgi:hypothetical protein
MAYFVRNASKIAFKRIKMFLLSKDFSKFACQKISATMSSFFILKGMVYIFEMCDIIFTKTETTESRQFESQDCLKLPTSLCDMSILRYF